MIEKKRRLPRDGIRHGTFGGRVRSLRLARGMDQYDLADATGLSLSTLQKVETRPVKIGVKALAAICRALGCRPGDLTGEGEGDDTTNGAQI